MYTNSHKIHRSSFQKGIVSYRDPFSYRSYVRRQNDYRIRLYWHFKQYIDSGSWVMFDTLTYDDAHLPHVCDFSDFDRNFSCFRSSDVKEFLDRLHSRLNYYGLGTFTHFVCSEYGHDDLYVDHRGKVRKGTKRPHYHVLFFFDNPNIDRVWMAKQIHDCWQCGRTDNYGSFGERERSYILHNTFDRNTLPLDRLLKVTNYVSKYVLKDVKFSKKVDILVKQHCRKNYKHLSDICNWKAFLHDCNFLKSQISEFVMLSNGFGKYALDCCGLDMQLIYDKSQVVLPDQDSVLKYYSIPEYYLRKLFYKLDHGHWVLNDDGRLYYRYHLENQSENYRKYVSSVVSNLDPYDRAHVLYLMDGRSFKDLADYVIYYKGRVCDPSSLRSIPSKSFVVSKLVSIDDDSNVVDRDPVPNIEYSWVLEPRTYWVLPDDLALPTYSFLSITDVLKRKKRIDNWKPWIIDSSWFPEHYDFDQVLEILNNYTSAVEISRQQLYDKKSELNRQLSLFGLKTDQ